MTKEEFAELHKTLAVLEYETAVNLSQLNLSDASKEEYERILDAIRVIQKAPCIIEGVTDFLLA